MKRLMIAVLAATVAGATLAATTSTNKVRRTAAERRALRDKRIAAEGGILVRPYAGKIIAIVNDQKRVPETDFFKPNQSFADLFGFPVKVVPPKTDVKDAALVITLSDNKTAPALLIAPEIPWAGINVGALAADDPKGEDLALRLRKELWRAFMYACGAANSIRQPCVMRPLFGLKDLDASPAVMPCPESLGRVEMTAKALGIGATSACTYRQACQEGWAPNPTNDVQKKIWDETYKMPDKPLKIEK